MENYNRKEEGSCEYFYYFIDGNDTWYLHRIDGPAMEVKSEVCTVHYTSLRNRWFYMGQQIDCDTQEEFESMLVLMAFW